MKKETGLLKQNFKETNRFGETLHKKTLFENSSKKLNNAKMRWSIIPILIVIPVVISAVDLYQDKFVFVFGWPLLNDSEVNEITNILETAAKHGFNGAVLSAGLDSLSKRSPEYLRRLKEIKKVCERNGLELIPCIFSVGYGSGLSHNPHLAEGFPVKDASFVVRNGKAYHVPDSSTHIVNGEFEEYEEYRFKGFNFHDQPGEISFPDTQIVHSGKASLRLENFKANPHGHGRIMQEVTVRPRACYRVSIWVKAEGLVPRNCFRLLVITEDRAREGMDKYVDLHSTTDWQKVTMVFNSFNSNTVRLYAGTWGGREGKVWLDDWTIEEVGPINVLRRPGTPVTVKSEDASIIYKEGKDFASLQDPNFSFGHLNREAPPLQLLPQSRIKEGQRLLVSWFHPMIIWDGQITVCMAEPELYEIWEHEARLIYEHLRPNRFVLSMDEIRMGGTCDACRGKDMAKLLGECITKQVKILRQFNPKAKIYIWSDMLDPNHNAHKDYCLVEGNFSGSWNYVPKDLIIALWGSSDYKGKERLSFFAEQGFQILIAAYYDMETLDDVKKWLKLAKETSNVRGFMYTTWRRKYTLLSDFGDLLTSKE